VVVALGPTRPACEKLLVLLEEAERRAVAELWKWVPWLPVQLRYLKSQSRFRLLRAGNQSLGKSTVALTDLLLSALGEHPHRQKGRRYHGEYWILCASKSQSIAVQGKLHDLIPPARLHPETAHNPKKGYRGVHPAVEVRHKDGQFSIIRIKTVGQGALNLSAATIMGALFDEPPAYQRVYTEVYNRTKATGGWVSISMTPINAPVGWIRDRVEKGLIEDIHTKMTVASLHPVGHSRPRYRADGVLLDAAWLAEERRLCPDHEEPVVIDGEWEERLMKRYFTNFHAVGANAHVHENPPKGEFDLHFGADHGSGPGKQYFCLPLVQSQGLGVHPLIYVIDECYDESGTSDEDGDAQLVMAMLARSGWTWGNIDGQACGDRVHMPGSARAKSNDALHAAIARAMGIDHRTLLPRIRTIKRGEGRGKGSVAVGSRWLFDSISRDCFGVHPRCVRMISALQKYTMRDDEHKDPIDALRYALDRPIFLGRRSPGSPRMRAR
jgi:hypothetical protein